MQKKNKKYFITKGWFSIFFVLEWPKIKDQSFPYQVFKTKGVVQKFWGAMSLRYSSIHGLAHDLTKLHVGNRELGLQPESNALCWVRFDSTLVGPKFYDAIGFCQINK